MFAALLSVLERSQQLHKSCVTNGIVTNGDTKDFETCFSLSSRLHFCFIAAFFFFLPPFASLRSPDGVDGQPPALPPKQLSRKTLSQIIQAHSQQSLLDNHLNEMYDVPVNADKTTVSTKAS